MMENRKKFDELFNLLDEIKEELLLVIKSFGTCSVKDLLILYWGQSYVENITNKKKLDVIEKYIYPIGFKQMNWREYCVVFAVRAARRYHREHAWKVRHALLCTPSKTTLPPTTVLATVSIATISSDV